MESITTITDGPSLLELLGIFPALLALIAVGLALLALIVRKKRQNIATVFALVSIGLCGMGITAWKQFEIGGWMSPSGATDPLTWQRDYSIAWMPAAVVLPACSLGFLLIAIAWVITKPLQNESSGRSPKHGMSQSGKTLDR